MSSITEQINPLTRTIDIISTIEMVRLINQEDARVATAVAAELVPIAQAIDAITGRMQRGGRLVYIGAGTSGRLGVLDASECPPTFSTPPELVVALLAGGDSANRQAIEGAEDDAAMGAKHITDLNIGPDDSVVGIAASGGTPYVLGGITEARRRGALTISLACNRPSKLEEAVEIGIAPLVGPEVIAGSTRLKAGTAQKMVLNMISTGVMIKLGKTFGNLMVDVRPTNAKLRDRALRIVAQACNLSEEAAAQALEDSNGEVKTAIVSVLAGVSPEVARQRLEENSGYVRKALSGGLVIGVDGGGTKTVALAASLDGQLVRRGFAGPSNYNAVGFEAACRAIDEAIAAALEGEALSALCLGLAGVGRQEDVDRFLTWAQSRYPNIPLTIVNDAQILLAAGAPSGAALALVCGTGSIAYGRSEDGNLVRAGGWGYLFGDEGSGYAIGAAALRMVMWAEDGRGEQTLLTPLLLERRGLKTTQDLIRSIYGAGSPRAEVAGLAGVVEQAAAQQDLVARSILDQSARDLALIVQAAYQKLGSQPVPLAITGGTILKGRYLFDAFLRSCEELGLVFSSIKEVKEPAEGALLLARQILNI